jgi:hypothetical protein
MAMAVSNAFTITITMIVISTMTVILPFITTMIFATEVTQAMGVALATVALATVAWPATVDRAAHTTPVSAERTSQVVRATFKRREGAVLTGAVLKAAWAVAVVMAVVMAVAVAVADTGKGRGQRVNVGKQATGSH